MKLKNIAIALACTGLLTLNVAAAPTQLHQLEFEDKTTITKIVRDENELTQVNVKLPNEEQTFTFTFTQDELNDQQVIKDKLSSLPTSSADKIANLLNRINKRSKLGFDVYIEKELDPEARIKIKEMTRHMEIKGREMEEKAKQLEVHIAEMTAHAAKMATNEAALDAREREFDIHIAELESHADEMESKAMELEVYFDKHGEELEMVMDRLADDVSDIASQYTNVQVEFIQQDDDGGNQHVFIIQGNEKSDAAEDLIESIKHSNLSETQKQAIRDALN
ncbi:hypothetical protein [Shewanella sp. UCD-KL12]|uniref:hypothetical protein n=1 Tax=Shewanella sp. UCD-KL12 TaxID=1917163 RepID=UPI00097089E8|nr:hypothetical protein [Shewanella sp. UCD-KL12]